jgi:hypothetical protein
MAAGRDDPEPFGRSWQDGKESARPKNTHILSIQMI